MTPLRGHAGRVTAVAWLDEMHVVTGASDGARVWHARSGKPVMAPLRHEHSSEVVAIAVSSDGRFVVTGGVDGTARVWELPDRLPDDGGNMATARPVAPLEGHVGPVVDVKFSADDTTIATAGSDKLAKLWDARTHRVRATFQHDAPLASIAFAQGGAWLVAGTRNAPNDGARIWRTQIAETGFDLGSSVNAIAAVGGLVVAGTEQSDVVVLRGDTRAKLHGGHTGRVHAVALAGRVLVTGGEDDQLLVWDVDTGTQTRTLGPIRPATFALRIRGDLVAAATSNEIELWSLSTGKMRTLPDENGELKAVELLPDGSVIAGGDEDGLTLWDPRGVPRRVNADAVNAMALSPDGRMLAVASQGHVKLYQVGTGGVVFPRIVPDPTGGILDAVAWADNTRLVTGGADGARIWDVTTGKLLGSRDAGSVNALAVAGSRLWTASEDGTVAAWDIGIDNESPADLQAFMAKNDPCALDDQDRMICK